MGQWPNLGTCSDFDREYWPMPKFGRSPLLSTGPAMVVTYDPDDPSKVLREDRTTPAGISNLPRDGLSGADAVSLVLERLLT
jgi:hypothetical protein